MEFALNLNLSGIRVLITDGKSVHGLVPYGYAGQPTSLKPFAIEDSIILTDSTCASACLNFTAFMARQANVKTIVVGILLEIAPIKSPPT